MAVGRLIDLDGDNLSIADDRDFDQESLSELELLDLSQPGGYSEEAFASSSRAVQAAKALEIAEEPGSPEDATAPPNYFAAIASSAAEMDRMPQSMSDTGLLSQDHVERGDAYAPERHLASQLGSVASELWRIFTEYIKTVEKKRGRRFGLTRRVIRYIITILVIVILLAIFLPIIIRAIIRHVEQQQWERERHPFRDHPAYKRDPHKDHPSTVQCSFDVFGKYEEHSSDYWYGRDYRYGRMEVVDDDIPNFHLFDEVDTALPDEFTDPAVSGTVEIISIPHRNRWERQEITIRTSVATTKPWQIGESWVNYDGDSLTVRSPSLRKGSLSQVGAPENSCLDVWVGIYIPVGMEVGNWTTSLRSLSFVDNRNNYVLDPDSDTPDAQQVANGAIKVLNSTTIKSNQGTIDISYWNSHQTTLETRRGHISGKYTFYDSLSVKTLGGEVDIEVDPLGGAMSRDKHHPLKLTTSTGSGRTNLHILHPSGQDWTPHFMESMHRTTSGEIKLHYPDEWAGTIEGVTMGGHADVKGKDVHKNPDSLDAPGEIHMMKGSKVSDWAGTLGRIDLESEAGSIELVIGDE